MTTQTDLPGLCPTLRTPHGEKKFSSLRPGDYIKADDLPLAVVLQNSCTLQIVELYFPEERESCAYSWNIVAPAEQVGRGKRRIWHPFLPRFLRNRVCEFSRP